MINEKVIENEYANFPTSTGSETVEDSKANDRPNVDEPMGKDNLEVCPDDPWGPNSPRRRIENMEASFRSSNTELTNSDKELEEEIYNEALKNNKYEETSGKIPLPESNTGESNKTSDQHETDIYEVFPENKHSINKDPTSQARNDQFLLKTYKDDEKDSCLGLSLGDLNSSRFSEPPSSDILINIDDAHEALDYTDAKQWTFLPLPGEVPSLLGQVRDEETGEIFNVFNDGPMETARSTPEYEDDCEKEDDIGWCSCYFCVRIVGLATVAAALGSLIWVAQL